MTALALFCFHLLEEKQKPPEKDVRERTEVKRPHKKKPAGTQVAKIDDRRERKRIPERHPESRVPETGKPLRIAILIDDIGQDIGALHKLLEIDAPLSFAVLPYQRYTTEAMTLLHLRNRDILLHCPMEPQSYPQNRPGEGAIFLSMSDQDIKKQMEKNLDHVPYAIGVNNHMGSRFTEDEEKMAVIMNVLKEKGLFFIDSRTTRNSRAKEAADQIGVPFLARKIFIDHDQSYETSLETLTRRLQEKDVRTGAPVLLIGHPYRSTILAIRNALPMMREKGVEIVPVSEIVRQ